MVERMAERKAVWRNSGGEVSWTTSRVKSVLSVSVRGQRPMNSAEYDGGDDRLGLRVKGTSSAPGAGASRVKIAQGGGRVRVVFMLLALAAALALVYLTPLRGLLTEVHQLSSWLRGLGWAAPAAFLAAAAGLIAIGCPRLLFCPIAGMAFGFFPGLLWTQVGTLIGSYGTFLFVRWAGREFVLRQWPKLHKYSPLIAEGSLSVLLIRQIPVSGVWINALLALSHVRHRDFLVGTAIGTLPEAIPATLLGAGVAQVSAGKRVAYILVAAIWFFIIWQLFRWHRRSCKRAASVREDGRGETI